MAESNRCKDCNKAVRPRQEGIQCDQCNGWTHRKCNTGVSREDYRFAVRNRTDIEFICIKCRDTQTHNQEDRPADGSFVVTQLTEQSSSQNQSDVANFNLQTTLVESFTAASNPIAHSTADSSSLSEQILQEPADLPRTSDDPPPSSFTVPVRHEEDSIAEESLPASLPEESQMANEYEIVTTSSIRGADKLFDKLGYSYTRKRQNKRTTVWRCSVRNNTAGVCPATVTQCGDIFTRGSRSHTHAANPGADTAAKVARDVKKTAKENVHLSAREIVDDVLLKEVGSQPITAVQNPSYIARNANYLRQTLRPVDPNNLNFELQLQHIPNNFFRKDIQVDNRRHIIFATDAQLQLLKKAKRWYIDSTFKVVRKPFTQLFSVHAFIRQGEDTKQVPLLFSLMSGKRKQDYTAILEAIKNLCGELTLRELVIDFESAMWNSFGGVFPGVQVRGCAFHYTQALWRHIQEVGLSSEYKENRSVNKYLRKFMALCFLPAEKIESVFKDLAEKSDSSPRFEKFIDYLDKNWINNRVWPPHNWTVFNQSVRTNNDTEGWHNRLKGRSGCNVAFYTLVNTLHTESLLVSLNF